MEIGQAEDFLHHLGRLLEHGAYRCKLRGSEQVLQPRRRERTMLCNWRGNTKPSILKQLAVNTDGPPACRQAARACRGSCIPGGDADDLQLCSPSFCPTFLACNLSVIHFIIDPCNRGKAYVARMDFPQHGEKICENISKLMKVMLHPASTVVGQLLKGLRASQPLLPGCGPASIGRAAMPTGANLCKKQ